MCGGGGGNGGREDGYEGYTREKRFGGLGWGGELALREIGDLQFLWLGREGRRGGRGGGRGYVSHSPSHMRIGVEKVKRECSKFATFFFSLLLFSSIDRIFAYTTLFRSRGCVGMRGWVDWYVGECVWRGRS